MGSKKPLLLGTIALLLALALLLFFNGDVRWIERRAYLLGTLVEIEAPIDKAITAAFQEIARVEWLTSKSKGELAQLNREAHERPVEVLEELFALLEEALKFKDLTSGKFDISLGKLVDLWGFGSEEETPRVPAMEEIARLLAGREIILDRAKRTVKLGPNAELDLGGIAKGYAVDRAIQVLKDYGVKAALVDAGGDIRILGSRPGKFFSHRPFRIAIQHPRAETKILGIIKLEGDRAIATSGDYERYFVQDGVRYHHILDPATGRPAQGCSSVTIIAPTALEADALATGIFVLGPERGMELIERLPEVEGIIVTTEGKIYKSSGLADLELEY
jgi:thiamine biosynthesis lipoprotein